MTDPVCVRRVILASASPRRQELLATLVPKFDIIPSDIPETPGGTPRRQVIRLAGDKAYDISKKYPDAIVIGADTLVAIGSQVLGKPKDESDAARMLARLSGKTHIVYTGVAIVCGPHIKTDCGITRVTFSPISSAEIDSYIGTGEPMDKAGAYGIQGYGAKFVRKINGCYFNVMGLPLSLLYRMLKDI